MIVATGQTTDERYRLHLIIAGWRGFAYSNLPQLVPPSAMFTVFCLLHAARRVFGCHPRHKLHEIKIISLEVGHT